MSELFDSLNFAHLYAGGAVLPASSPRRQHGTGRCDVAAAAAAAVAAVDTWHRKSGCKAGSSKTSTALAPPPSSTPLRGTAAAAAAGAEGPIYGSTSTEHADSFATSSPHAAGDIAVLSSSPHASEGRVFWNAAPSPSVQLQIKQQAERQRKLAQDSAMVPLGTQAFREELLRAPLGASSATSPPLSAFPARQSSASAAADGGLDVAVTAKATASRTATRVSSFRRRAGRRGLRRCGASVSASGPAIDGFDQLLNDLNQHLEADEDDDDDDDDDRRDPPGPSREPGKGRADTSNKENSALEDALVEHMGRVFSQEKEKQDGPLPLLKRQNTWARTVSMPSHSPGRVEHIQHNGGTVLLRGSALGKSPSHNAAFGRGAMLGKREFPESPCAAAEKPSLIDDEHLRTCRHNAGGSKPLAQPARVSPSKRSATEGADDHLVGMHHDDRLIKPRRGLQRTTSEGMRASETNPLGAISLSHVLAASSSPRKHRFGVTLGVGRGPAPRVGLSKSARSAPAATPLTMGAGLSDRGSSTQARNGPTAPFRQPLRRSPRKASVATGTSRTTDGTDRLDKRTLASDPCVFNKPRAGTHSLAESSSSSTNRRRQSKDRANVGDSSFDTSMTSVDESAFCEAAELVEASQPLSQSAMPAPVDGRGTPDPDPRTNKNQPGKTSPQPHPHPHSDDSLEIDMSGDVDCAILASMDAQGW